MTQKSDPTLCWISNSITKPWQDILTDVNKWRKINHLPIRRSFINGSEMFGLKVPRVRNAILTPSKSESSQKVVPQNMDASKQPSSIKKDINITENDDDSPGMNISQEDECIQPQYVPVEQDLIMSTSSPQIQNEIPQSQQITVNKQQIADVIRINTRNSEAQFVFDFNSIMDKIRFMKSLINHELSIRSNPTNPIEI